ncbi:MAG: GNAT family N-acetyltransferase [Candidatus Bathyarchaeota archaeon]|nr:MAG: GNAT family N-acetyltransferase [Candidatus Bathyarchaeota archaeon]
MEPITKIKIRSLNENDLDAVVEIDNKILGKRRHEYWKRKIGYADIYPRPALVAEVDGKVVGFILGYVSGWEFGVPDTVGWIDTLGVDPDYQNQGVGKILFNKLIENFKRSGKEAQPEAKETAIEGVSVVYTLVRWNDWNLLRFFHKMGFKKGEMISLELEI